MKEEYLKIIKEKGEFDFEVSSLVETLTLEEYEELKSMLITAIGTMEEMRRNIYIENQNKDKEIERLNNIINELLKRQNEALNYISNFLSMDNRYKHGNGNDELELVRRILNKHNQEPKGSDSNE